MFRARLPSIFSTCTKCHACHGICTLSPLDAALPMRFTKNTQHTSKVLRLPRKMTMDTSKVLRLPRKLQHIFWKRHKSIAPATQNDFRHVPEHVWMSRSATPATRNEATTRLQPPKRITSAELPIGTAIRGSRGRLRTVALVNATSSEHTLNPQTPRVKREPLLRIREKEGHIHHVSENCGCVYKQRSSTTSPSTFMPESATLPCMRHLLAYLSRTFENHHLAISLKTTFLMNCDCLTFSCYLAQPKCLPTQNQKYINDTMWNLDESTQQLSTFNIIAPLPYIYKPQASLNQQSSIFKIWNLGKGDILQFPP